jgi:hypothetical protein
MSGATKPSRAERMNQPDDRTIPNARKEFHFSGGANLSRIRTLKPEFCGRFFVETAVLGRHDFAVADVRDLHPHRSILSRRGFLEALKELTAGVD